MADKTTNDTNPETLSAARRAIPDKANRGAGATPLIDCAGCRECLKDCPLHLRIPDLMDLYNEYLEGVAVENLRDAYRTLTSDTGNADDCAGCRVCEGSCKNHVKIADTVHKLSALFD